MQDRDEEAQSPSCAEVLEEHREICAHSTTLDSSLRPSALQLLAYFPVNMTLLLFILSTIVSFIPLKFHVILFTKKKRSYVCKQ